jgi:tetratricopeptide (TPR) repeat protein
MSQSAMPEIKPEILAPVRSDALASILARAALHTGLMLTDGHNLQAEALAFLQKAVALQPDNAEAIKGLARASHKRATTLLRESKPLQAENYLRKALALKPDLEEARVLLASIVNDDAQAPFLGLCQKAIESFNNGQLLEAETGFRRILAIQFFPAINDGLIHALNARAINAYNNIQFAEAETALWEILTLQPDNKLAAETLAHVTNVIPRYVHNILDNEYLPYVHELRHLLTVQDVADASFIRIGSPADGGYVVVDKGLDNAIVYSLGVGDNVSLDLDLANRCCQIFQYDHTIEGLPLAHDNFHWSKIGITGTESADPVLRTLDQLIHTNGHRGRSDLILKTDIETFEWEMFAEMPEETLCQFSQIFGEFHRLARVIDPEYRDAMFKALRKINKYFQLVHAHANNFTGLAVISGVPVYYCMELTFIRRDQHVFTPNTRSFPTPMDFPCIAKLPDLFLDTFQG